jgi:hypothetical protein
MAANPHYKYAQTNGNGIAVCEVDAAEMRVLFLSMQSITQPNYPGVGTKIQFRTAAGSNTIVQS